MYVKKERNDRLTSVTFIITFITFIDQSEKRRIKTHRRVYEILLRRPQKEKL